MSNDRQIRNIALIGFMGTGKSSVGRLIAEQLNFEFIDTDDWIEQQSGKSVSRIFAEDGEPVFRQWENQVVLQLGTSASTVISTGGGLGANEKHLEHLKDHSVVVCLWASPEKIWSRVQHQSHRPLLKDPDPLLKIRQLLTSREVVYKQADVLLNTDLRSVREVAQLAVHHYHSYARQR